MLHGYMNIRRWLAKNGLRRLTGCGCSTLNFTPFHHKMNIADPLMKSVFFFTGYPEIVHAPNLASFVWKDNWRNKPCCQNGVSRMSSPTTLTSLDKDSDTTL